MVFQNVAGCKSFSASTTCIRPLIGVRALVFDSRRIVGEAASTVLTGKGTLSGMLAHMSLKFRSGTKAFVTDSDNKSEGNVMSLLKVT